MNQRDDFGSARCPEADDDFLIVRTDEYYTPGIYICGFFFFMHFTNGMLFFRNKIIAKPSSRPMEFSICRRDRKIW